MRKRISAFLLFMMLVLGVSAEHRVLYETELQMSYQTEDSIFIENVLAASRVIEPSSSLTLFFANQLVGRPYVGGTLEINYCEQLVVNTRELDCTTFVETVVALTLCAKQEKYSFGDYVASLETIRYRRGEMSGYESRLHYFSDWIYDNGEKGMVREIQSPETLFSGVQRLSLNFMSTHPQLYKSLKNNPSLVKKMRSCETALSGKTVRYIPRQTLVRNADDCRTIKDGDIIAILTNVAGLDIAHVGFAVWRTDGLHLLHASTQHKRVVIDPMPFSTYMQKHTKFRGVRIVRVL